MANAADKNIHAETAGDTPPSPATTTTTTTTNNNNNGERPWVQRFGTLTSVVKRQGRKGDFVTFAMDCGAFKQTGVAFGADQVAFLLAAGVGANVWTKGPIETRTVVRNGATHDEEAFKVVFFRNRDARAADMIGGGVRTGGEFIEIAQTSALEDEDIEQAFG